VNSPDGGHRLSACSIRRAIRSSCASEIFLKARQLPICAAMMIGQRATLAAAERQAAPIDHAGLRALPSPQMRYSTRYFRPKCFQYALGSNSGMESHDNKNPIKSLI
jgi:hypothetical protein